jgi:hypothetical protein
MNTQTLINIFLSLVTVYLAIKNFVLASHKNTKQESAEWARIQAQLDIVTGMLRDLQKDVRTSTADFRALSDRVLKIEIEFQSMKEDKHGKQ